MTKLKQITLVYAGILGTYLIADFIWLGLISTSEYTNSIGHLMRDSSFIWPWIAFYTIYCACILRLAIFNGQHPKFSSAFLNAFTLGLASYGAYNLTNYAILDTWPLSITFKDWVWGTFVTTLSGVVGYITFVYTKPKLIEK